VDIDLRGANAQFSVRNGDVQERRRHPVAVADSPLVTPSWLRDNLAEPHVVVADVRGT
jgi:hypothetical protein